MGLTLRERLVEAFEEARLAAEAGERELVTDGGHADDVIRIFIDWLRTPEVRNAIAEGFVLIGDVPEEVDQWTKRFTGIENALCRRAVE